MIIFSGKESGAICDRAFRRGVGYERLAADGPARGDFPLRDFRKPDRHWLNAGAWINWKLVAGRLRVHTEVNNNALTLPDYFTGRFEDKSRVLRIISALVILLFFTIYCASGIVAGARLFESTFGMSYETALWAGAAATIIYTFVGGFLAVSWTDTVQASLMIFALILTPVIVIISVGGFGDSLEVIKQKSIENIDMLKGLNFVAIISLMGWGWVISVSRIFWRALWRRIRTTASFTHVALV